MARAVDRVMATPNLVVQRDYVADARDVDVSHHYTPSERGQILAFCWWVYVNRSAWPRRKLAAAITSVSPLMLFSSSFLADMTGIPASTASKHMLKPTDINVTRITGTCDPWILHHLLQTALRGEEEYRQTIRDLTLSKGVPKAMLSRISGIPVAGILRPERGFQFFPERPDWDTGEVCSLTARDAYWKHHHGEKKKYDPQPGNQRTVRDALAGTPLGNLRATSAPIPGPSELPYHLAIPGLPTLRPGEKPDEDYFKRITDWECAYHLPASARVGP